MMILLAVQPAALASLQPGVCWSWSWIRPGLLSVTVSHVTPHRTCREIWVKLILRTPYSWFAHDLLETCASYSVALSFIPKALALSPGWTSEVHHKPVTSG